MKKFGLYLSFMKESESTSRRKFIGTLAAGAMSLTLADTIAKTTFAYPATGLVANDTKFVPVMLTPYKADLSIDFDGLSRLIDFYVSSGAKGFFANCLSSEMYNLNNEERLALVKHVVKRVNGKMPVVATGSFGDSVESRAAYTKRMFDTGVDAVILITSHFAEKTDDEAVFLRNLDKYLALTGSIPLGTYECPSPYKRILTPAAMQHLLSTNRLIYHKDTTIDLEKIRVKLDIVADTRLEFYDAHTPNTLHSLRMGARGMSCIAGNFYPELFAWMCKHFAQKRRKDDVEWLQGELTRMDSIISKGYSLSAKYFLNLRGVPMEINSRRNKSALSLEQMQTLKDINQEVTGWHERLGI